MEIGGIDSGGFDYQALLEMQKTMAMEASASKSSASSSIEGIETGSSSSSQNSSSNENRQDSAAYVRNQQQMNTNPAEDLKANAHRFAIDQAVRQGGSGANASNVFNNSLNTATTATGVANGINQANFFRATAGIEANGMTFAGVTGTSSAASTAATTGMMGSTNSLIASMFGSPISLNSDKLSAATSASAITAKYATQSQAPVLNSFKPVDKYI